MSDDRSIQVGDTIVLYVTFKNSSLVVADPTTVQLWIRPPGEQIEELTGIDHVAASGYYERAVTVDKSGVWHSRWLGVGGDIISEASETRFTVDPKKS